VLCCLVIIRRGLGLAGAGDIPEDAPMLIRNAIPLPKDLDEKERLKAELELREDDIDPHSQAYQVLTSHNNHHAHCSSSFLSSSSSSSLSS
jgi:hypothetical protein